MTDMQLIEKYLALVNESSRKTIRRRLNRFGTYLRSHNLTLASLLPENIASYAAYLGGSALAKSSRYAYLSTVRQLVAALHRSGDLPANPWPQYLTLHRPEYIPRRVLSQEATARLLDHCGENTEYPGRMRAILEVAYGCGMRRMELRNLNLGDIRGDTLFIRGKGGKERIVPLGRTAAMRLEEYIDGERLRIVSTHNGLEEALFVSDRGGRMSISAFALILRRALPGKSRHGVTLHSLRHACATHMLENGASIGVLQRLLGHSNLSTTQQYTCVETKCLRRVLAKCHPRP
jgi:site-specific recombinase XerD